MKRKTSATVIMYTVLVFFFVIWIFPIYTAITKSCLLYTSDAADDSVYV